MKIEVITLKRIKIKFKKRESIVNNLAIGATLNLYIYIKNKNKK